MKQHQGTYLFFLIQQRIFKMQYIGVLDHYYEELIFNGIEVLLPYCSDNKKKQHIGVLACIMQHKMALRIKWHLEVILNGIEVLLPYCSDFFQKQNSMAHIDSIQYELIFKGIWRIGVITFRSTNINYLIVMI